MANDAILAGEPGSSDAVAAQEAVTGRLLAGALNVLATLALSAALWFVLLHPDGVLKLYTPMYGFSLVAVLAAVIVSMARIGDGWPLHRARWPRPVRGLALTAGAIALTALVVYAFFWGFLGRFGVTYFSPPAIVAAGGVGAEFFNARENASTAIVYFTAAFLWFAVALPVGLGAWPWQRLEPGARAFSRLLLVTLLAVVAYAVLFHPHVTQLFHPAQTFAGVPPWWASFAQTGSAYFNLGWVLTTVAVLACADLLWGDVLWRPFAREGGAARGVTAFGGSLLLGLALFAVGLRVMTAFWGEPFQGGQYTDAPYFRHLHVAEVAGFAMLAAYALDTFFGKATTAGRRLLWTALTLAGAAVLHVAYYSPLATRVLGKVPGMAQPEDTPLVFTLLVLALVLIQREFFAGWPLRRRVDSA
jgi:hypothetical protein